jgi:hypothetical protein
MTQFEMSAGLNDSAKFISALGQLVLAALGESTESRVPIFDTERRLAAASMAAD